MPFLLRYTGPARLLRITALCLLASMMAVAGCRRDAPKPDPEPRYRGLGPKPDLPDYLKGTILETADVYGIEPVRISGYGVVVNLENTGRDDGIPTAVRQHILNTAQVRGLGSELTDGPMGQLPATQFLADPRTSIVRVDGIVPPGARFGQRIDVTVTALDSNTTTSLARGELYQTELHSGLIDAQNPGERVNKAGVARGRLMVNPVYALYEPTLTKDDPAARESLRVAYIPDGGVFQGNRTFLLRLREPSYRTARAIENRINLQFGRPVAAAQDEGVVALAMPEEFGDDWAHFVGVVTTLYFYGINKGYAVERAEELVATMQESSLPTSQLEGISYALEGLGPVAVPSILPLLSHPNPAVAFWAARAAAFNREPAAVDALVAMASQRQNPWAVAAAETLGDLPPTPSLGRATRALLDVEDNGIRIAAYEALIRQRDPAINSVEIGGKEDADKQFFLDLVPSRGSTIVYATRTGTPRIAIIGPRPSLKSPMFASAFGDRLTVSVDSEEIPAGAVAAGQSQSLASIYFRPINPVRASAVRAPGIRASPTGVVVGRIRPELVELIARLGGEAPPGELPIRLAYGDVLAVLKQLSDSRQLLASGRPVPLILQDAAVDLVEEAPTIPGLEFGTARTEVENPGDGMHLAPGISRP